MKQRQIKHGLESPSKKIQFLNNSKVLVRGWCFDSASESAPEVRVEVGDRTIYCFPEAREDIRQIFGTNHSLPKLCGFQSSFSLGNGLKLLVIKAKMLGGESIPIGRRLVFNRKNTSARNYPQWIKTFDGQQSPRTKKLARRLLSHRYRPCISILLSTQNAPLPFLKLAIESVFKQSYPNWELCIQHSPSQETNKSSFLKNLIEQDSRVKVGFLEKQENKSLSLNKSLELAQGEFITFLHETDEFAPSALGWVVDALNENLDLDILFTDEDKINEQGDRLEPWFKPDWNPDLLLSQNYFGRLKVIRKSMVDQLGGFRLGYEGHDNWDLVLRIVEQSEAKKFRHIPMILYHSRVKTKTFNPIEEEERKTSKKLGSRRRILSDYLIRNKIKADVIEDKFVGQRIQYHVPDALPKVSIIIPTRDRVDVLKNCIESILRKTSYSNYVITIVDNDSQNKETKTYFTSIQSEKIKIVKIGGSFNFSKLVNCGVASSPGEIVALVNNDTEIISSEWLNEMASQSIRPEIGVVGAKLYYPDKRIQHAGVVLGIGGVAGHIFRKFDGHADGPMGRLKCVQNFSAVTAACMVVKRSIFEQIGGFNEKDLPVAFNDIDFCLRILNLGYRNLFTPWAELFHHEAYSRGEDNSQEKQLRFRSEFEYMQRTWGPMLENDPAYNLNLSLVNENFELSSPPRIPS